ncbi:MAG: hypothetical protein ACI4F7_00485 [Acutalibacteraceae bacterium]
MEAARRWEAYWNHDIIDRPIMLATLPKPGANLHPADTYKDRVYGDLDTVLQNAFENAKNTLWLGERVPDYWASLGTHEIASFCGYEIEWGADGQNLNWCKHNDRDWDEILPISVDKEGFWWKRSSELYKATKEKFGGRLISWVMDFHTNLDLLLSIRGDAQLCYDTFDYPELIDKGIENSCTVFKELWDMFEETSGCREYGYTCGPYSEEKPTATLACDFSALIGKEAFARWGVPALEFESGVVGERSVYHWDGPDAIKHCDALCQIKNLHTFAYVPTPGTYHTEFIDLYKKCQERGKGICFAGTPDEIKIAHKELKPEYTVYTAFVSDEKEFYELEKWLKDHT